MLQHNKKQTIYDLSHKNLSFKNRKTIKYISHFSKTNGNVMIRPKKCLKFWLILLPNLLIF